LPEPITVATRKRVPTNSAVTLLCREVVDIGVNGRPWKMRKPIQECLLQLRVLGLGLLQDGDIGVGIFPERKEILVGGELPARRRHPVPASGLVHIE
jgi:hypothetical protein